MDLPASGKPANIQGMLSETQDVLVNVLALQPLSGTKADVLALADVEIILDGVSITLHGVQLRANGQRTEVSLPRYRTPAGEWKAAVTLPEELRAPIADVVIAAALEAGIVREVG